MTATAEEKAASREISDDKARLQALVDKAAEMKCHGLREEAIAQARHGEFTAAITTASAKAAGISRQISGATPAAVLEVIKTAASDFSAFREIEELTAEHSRIVRFITATQTIFLPEAERSVVLATANRQLAEAALADALCEQREFELRLALIPVATLEGEITVNLAGTATGELRRLAASLRIEGQNSMEKFRLMQAKGVSKI